MDVNRIVVGGQIVMIVALLVLPAFYATVDWSQVPGEGRIRDLHFRAGAPWAVVLGAPERQHLNGSDFNSWNVCN